MSGRTLKRWEQDFRRRANGDKLAVFRDSLRALQLRAKPQLMLEGTIQMVGAAAAYATMDGRPYAPFLAMQTYDPAQSATAVYALTFGLCGKAFARLLVGRELRELDLADLYGHPWQEYKVCGYDCFWIVRADRTVLNKRELARLERLVAEDLRCDYPEDELDLWFDDAHTDGALFVTVQDCEGVDVSPLRVFRAAKAIEVQRRL